MAKRGQSSGSTRKKDKVNKIIEFPNHIARWQAQFKAASPAERHEHLKQALNNGSELDEDTLRNAFAAVSQILTLANRYDEQFALAQALQQQAPEVYQQILPVQNLMLLHDAIFHKRSESFTDLCDDWIQHRAESPLQGLLLATRLLLAAGYTETAMHLALGLAESPTDQILRDHARTLQAEQTLDQALRKLIGRQAVDWQKIRAKLHALGLSRPACSLLQKRLKASESENQIAILEAYESNHEGFFDQTLITFGRWMLESHGLSLMLSSEILSSAKQFWDDNKTLPKDFNDSITFSLAELENYLEYAQLEPFSLIMLLWGLPYLYDWLVSADFCSPQQSEQMMSHLAIMRKRLLAHNGPGLWSFAFVYDWPAPFSTDLARWAKEGRLLRKHRHHTLPLSHNPADNPAYDADPFDDGPRIY